jgi:hypothetical protein
MHDAAQNAPIVLRLRAPAIARNKRFNLHPLRVAKPKQVRSYPLAPPNRLTNLLNLNMVNWVLTLVAVAFAFARGSILRVFTSNQNLKAARAAYVRIAFQRITGREMGKFAVEIGRHFVIENFDQCAHRTYRRALKVACEENFWLRFTPPIIVLPNRVQERPAN